MAKTTPWGNYRDYQGPANQNPGSAPAIHVHDVRLTLLDSLLPGLFRAKNCLDIGCNAGSVSCQLAFDFGAASVTGADIDPELVRQAEKSFALRSSRIRPGNNADHSDSVVDYFPISAILEHGFRFGGHSNHSKGAYDHTVDADEGEYDDEDDEDDDLKDYEDDHGHDNHDDDDDDSDAACEPWPSVRFVSGDWVVSSNPATSGPYDVILALSVIKWIHLEHGDEGLVSFFRKCSSSLAPGGFFVVELQDWESYEKAICSHKSPHFRESFGQLQYRPETDFSELLQEQGLKLCVTSEDLPRRISVYRREE